MSDSGASKTTTTATLAITFSGPFVYEFPDLTKLDGSARVNVYAPYCPYHSAGFYFSTGAVSEIDLCSGSGTVAGVPRHYTVDSDGIEQVRALPAVMPTRDPSRERSKAPLPAPFFRLQPQTAIRLDKVMFSLSLPLPHSVFPLYLDSLEIVDGYATVPSNDMTPYCTALRFFYHWHSSKGICLKSSTGNSAQITPPVPVGFAAYGDIAIRLEGLSLLDETDRHSDARSCFASLINLVGREMWLNYGDGMSSPTNPSRCGRVEPTSRVAKTDGLATAHPGGDCYAPAIVIGL